MLMQKYKQQLKEAKRRATHERIGALALAIVTLMGLASLSKDAKGYYREVVTNPSFAFNQLTERENETARMPVRFDVGIRKVTIGGS